MPYRAGVRPSASTGEPIYVCEFRAAPRPLVVASDSHTPLEDTMDALEQYVADLITKALHKQVPAMSPADDAKVAKAVEDFVSTAMDLTAIYFALRAAKGTR